MISDLKNTKRSARGIPQGEGIPDTSRVRGEPGGIQGNQEARDLWDTKSDTPLS